MVVTQYMLCDERVDGLTDSFVYTPSDYTVAAHVVFLDGTKIDYSCLFKLVLCRLLTNDVFSQMNARGKGRKFAFGNTARLK